MIFCLSSLGIFCTFCSEAVFFAASERNHLFEKAGSARRQRGPQGILAQADEIDVGGRLFDKWQGKKQKEKRKDVKNVKMLSKRSLQLHLMEA